MHSLSIATTEADAAAVGAIEQHHGELAGALSSLVEALVEAAARGEPSVVPAARSALVGWAERELLPHAAAEEETLYPPAQQMTEGRLLVAGMIEEHRALVGLLGEIASSTNGVRAAAGASALLAVFRSHLNKENELVLPLLASASEVSLAGLLDGMHEAMAAHPESTEPLDRTTDGHGEHSCGCGESDDGSFPELDARIVPHAIRHATIFGALDAVPARSGMVLVAPHDPLPLLTQIEQRSPGAFSVEYLERGPEAWRLQFVRQSA